jgi:short-subunit dehydrogenase
MPNVLDQAVVVITGASSGIGRAAARRFRQNGASVVLTARRGEALEELATELAPEALAIAGDVSDPEHLQRVAREAVARFGRIDVWVNNASVVAFGRIADIPPDEYSRVLDVNVKGYAYGAQAAYPHLKASGGTLINVGSLNSRVPGPYYSPYIAAKFAVRGLSLALRQEWREDGIAVGLVLPASVDTPLFNEAANWYGRRVKAIAPANNPNRIARAIVAMARRPRRERLAGLGGATLVHGHALAPRLVERLVAWQAPYNGFDQDRPASPSPGNLHEPSDGPISERGGWTAGRTVLPALRAAVRRG